MTQPDYVVVARGDAASRYHEPAPESTRENPVPDGQVTAAAWTIDAPRADAACECGYTPREAGRLPAAVALVTEVLR